MRSVLVLNGPNLNLLGHRSPEFYGRQTLAQIENSCRTWSSEVGLEIEFLQSNSESTMIDAIQRAMSIHSGIIINAAAYTSTSIALRDAIEASKLPCIEIHLSNIYAREKWRSDSYLSAVSVGVICGFRETSYRLAILAMADLLES
ncbi:MAG: type II 3-dehydroquinate dehydratase [Rhodobacteraceae bacterium]|nr:type II 3-dehydroquinate dehydratase [Paracoccaceae bacterium]